MTTDGGQTWTRESGGKLTEPTADHIYVYALDIDSTGKVLYLGSCGRGVFRSGAPVVDVGVGGIAELSAVAGTPLESEGSSGSSVGLIAGITAAVAASAVAVGGTAWLRQETAEIVNAALRR